MRRELRSRAGRFGRHVTGLLAAILLSLVAQPGAAWADDSLLSADPATGAALGATPVQVTLQFAAKVSGDDSHVGVSTEAGRDASAGHVRQSGPDTLVVPLQGTAAG